MMNRLKNLSLQKIFLLLTMLFLVGMLAVKFISHNVVDAFSDNQREVANTSTELLRGFQKLKYIISDVEHSAYLNTLLDNEEMLIATAAKAGAFYELHEELVGVIEGDPQFMHLQEPIRNLDRDYKAFTLLLFAMSAQHIEELDAAQETLQKLQRASEKLNRDLDEATKAFEKLSIASSQKAYEYEEMERLISLFEMALIGGMLLIFIYLMRRTLFMPMDRLVEFLSSLNASRDLKSRYGYSKENELGAVSRHLNQLLASLEKSTVTNSELEKRIAEELKNSREKDHILYTQAKHAQMGEMFNMIAHQWRQPLQSISASTGHIIVKKELGKLEDEDIVAHTALVNTLTQELSKTINDFMALSKPAKEHTEFSFNALVSELSSFMGAQLTTLEIALLNESEEDVKVLTHRQELFHVLLNLVSNAKDALEESDVRPKNIIMNAAYTRNGQTLITVYDRGGGIPETIIDRIFTPYFTTKEQGKGTGIGLYMSKRIVEEVLGGKLDIRNENNGALFSITLDRGSIGSGVMGE